MRLFVHFDDKGQVLSAAKVHGTGGALENPFLHVERQDRVLEMAATEELQALDAHEIAEQYKVDMKRKTLRKRPQARPAKPETKHKTAVKKPHRKPEGK